MSAAHGTVCTSFIMQRYDVPVVMTQQNTRLRVGQYGYEIGTEHEFEIVDTSDSEVKIRYVSDGRTAWWPMFSFETDGRPVRLRS